MVQLTLHTLRNAYVDFVLWRMNELLEKACRPVIAEPCVHVRAAHNDYFHATHDPKVADIIIATRTRVNRWPLAKRFLTDYSFEVIGTHQDGFLPLPPAKPLYLAGLPPKPEALR